MTMHQRYQANPSGCDSFNTWMRPYDELHAKFPLGCTKVSEEWLDLWKGLGEMLKMPAQLEYLQHGVWVPVVGVINPRDVAFCLWFPLVHERGHKAKRVVLLDGTIIKEWGST